jgi:hypothetical protein
MIKNGEPIKLLVVDSLTAHFRAEFAGRGQLADRQQKLNKYLHNLMKMAEQYNLQLAELPIAERFKKLQSNLIELRQAQSSLIQAQDRYINALFKAKMAANAIQYVIGELGSE